MKKLINLAFALLLSVSAFAQGFNVQVCVNITGPQPNGPIIATLTYDSNGSTYTMVDTLSNVVLPYSFCFPSYMQLPDSGFFAYGSGSVHLSTCAPTQSYTYSAPIYMDTTITVNAQNCQAGASCSATLTQVNGTTMLSATGTGVAPFSYSWDGGITFGSSSQYNMNAPGTYCVTIMDGFGCTATDCYTYTGFVPCQAIIDISGNGPYTLQAAGTGVPPLTYMWSDGSTGPIITANVTGNYCITIADANGCVDTTCVFLTVGNTCNVSIVEDANNGTNYLLAIPDSTFSGFVGYTWEFNGAPLAGATDAIYYPTQPGVYCVTAYFSNNCIASNCYNFDPGNPIGGCSVYAVAVPDSSANNTFIIYAYPTGTPPFTYSWIFSDGSFTDTSTAVVQFNNGGVNWANVTVTDANGCVSSYSVVLPATPSSNCYSGFNTYSNYQFGYQGEVFFQSFVQANNPMGVSYSWDFGDGSSSTLANPQHTYTSTGYYYVCLTTTYNGCTYTSCFNEYVDLTWWNNNPFQGACTAGFIILTNQVNNAGLINIINTSQGNNLFYTWSFGNGFISNNPLPFTTINNPGIYEICVSILDTVNNCSDAFCDTITIDSLGNVYRAAMSGNIGILVSGAPQPNALLTTVDFKEVQSEISIAPNPSNGNFNINAHWMQGTSQVEVLDLTGKLVHTSTINTTKGQKSVTLNLQDVANGSYLVRVVSDQRVQTVKLIVNH